jgi:flagellar biosynthesis/type III secretory pathway protein FliH
MGTLIEARMQEWEERWVREGLEQGRSEGREEGLREGEARMLQRQLRRRFGELPSWVTARLRDAAPEQLERWAEHLLEVESLESLFERGKT